MSQDEIISLTERFLESNRNATIISVNQDEMQTKEFQSFKNCISRSYYKNSKLSSRFSMKERINIFDRKEASESSPFENILVSNEDKSAIISLIIRSYNLCSDEEFWTKVIDLENVMRHYALNDESSINNLFSILMYDWHNHETSNTKKQIEYMLEIKFDAYRKSGKCLFKKLFDIIDDDQYQGYHHVCLRIIYQYLHERNSRIKSYEVYVQESEIDLLQSAIHQSITNALKIKNKEYKIRILKILVVFLKNDSFNENYENYENLKSKILDAVKYKFEVFSSYHVAIESIAKHCDETFFQLVFQLKENFLKNFEFAFEDYIQIYRKFYGEYWKVAIKENARLLYHVAEEQCERKLLKTVEFIFNHCNFIELNSTILTTLQQVDDFYVIFNEPLDEKEKDFWVNVEKLVETTSEDEEGYYKLTSDFLNVMSDKKFTKKILFGRKSVDQLSLLEKILQNVEFNDLLEEIWKKFQLFEKPDILLLKNPLGMYLMQYVLKATSFNQLVAYLMLQSYEGVINFNKPKQYMVMQNALYYSLKGESIIESQVHINLKDEEIDGRFFNAITYLLEEIGTIKEIENDGLIDYFLDIINSYENFSKDMFEIDDLLGFMIAYWNPQGKKYQVYKETLTGSSPFYELLFMIVEKKSEEFIRLFPKKIGKMEETYKVRYNIVDAQKKSEDNLYELYTSNLIYVLFFAAIKNNQRKIIECIFNNDAFVTINFEFPPNMKAQEIHYYAALTFLNRKHELGRSNIPKDWLTQEVLEEFLDSRINYHDKDLVEIDCTSMLHAESQKIKVKCRSDITKDILMLEDRNSLEYIKDNENLKEFIAHPVVETYINLKSFKYQRIFEFNFWIFVMFYIIPFLALISKSHLNGNEALIRIYDLFYLDKWHYFGIVFLIIRETFQCYISDSIKEYFSHLSNKLDALLIILSILLSVCASHKKKFDMEGNLRYLEASLILFITINATSSLPSAYVPLNMQILKRVALTFLGLFYTFAIILIAFTLSFFIIFEGELNAQVNISNSEPVDNFKRLDTSFVKIITMLGGEYSIEAISIDFMQLIFFAIFVITAFILYNLILGLAIENVQDIKTGSRKFILQTKAKKLINIGEKLEKYYHKTLPPNPPNDNESIAEQANSLKRIIANFFYPIVKFSLMQYIYVHSFQKIFVDIKTGDVFINVDQKYEHILKKGYNKWTKFKVSEVTLQEIQDIINAKNKKVYEDLKKRISKEEREK